MSGGLFDDEDERFDRERLIGEVKPAVVERRRGRSRLEVQDGKVVTVAHTAPRPSVVVTEGDTPALLEALKVTLLRVRNHVKPGSGGLPEWLIKECTSQVEAIDRALAPRE